MPPPSSAAASSRQSSETSSAQGRTNVLGSGAQYVLRNRVPRISAASKREPDDGDDQQEEPVVYGRREIESDSSDYQPSDESPSPEPEARKTAAAESDRVGDIGVVIDAQPPSLKRSRERALSSVSTSTTGPSTKRPKVHLNSAYLHLLNEDIDDARRQYVADEWPKLSASQVGLSVWTEEEKEMLYESISRLGRDDIRGVAARVGSKSELEVRHYLRLLSEETTRYSTLGAPRHTPPLADVPAALEISATCCRALEAVADSIAQHIDSTEAQEELHRWGHHWLLTGANCNELTAAALETADMVAQPPRNNKAADAHAELRGLGRLRSELHPDALKPLALLHVPNMLLLSERVFMNGVAEDANWMGLGGLPTSHTSALCDLYNLVYSLTQRLVAAAAYVSRSNARSKRLPRASAGRPDLVRRRDVMAAVASLGLETDSGTFWARCPRRLGLRVSRSAAPFAAMDGVGARRDADAKAEPDEEEYGGADDDMLAYDKVEALLLAEPGGLEGVRSSSQPLGGSQMDIDESKDVTEEGEEEGEEEDDDDDDDDDNDDSDDDGNEDKDGSEDDVDSNEDSSSSSSSSDGVSDDDDDDDDDNDDDELVEAEVDEAMGHAAIRYPNANTARQYIKRLIIAGHDEEAAAAAADASYSRIEEQYLCSILGTRAVGTGWTSAPPGDEDGQRPQRPQRQQNQQNQQNQPRQPLDEVIDTGRGWRDRVQYAAEWEAAAAEAGARTGQADEEEAMSDV